MKTKLFFLLLIPALFLNSFFKKATTPDMNTNSGIYPNFHCPAPSSFSEIVSGTGNKTDDKNIDQNWYQNAIEKLQKEEYNITYSDELGEYQSPNRANNIRFIYHNDGFTAKTRDNRIPLFDVNDKTIQEKDKKYEKTDEWGIQFQIANYEFQMRNEKLVADGDKAYVENENIRIDYTNNEEGMRQDFIVKQKLSNEGKLRLNISADTKLKMIVGADGLMFKDKDGVDKMKYSSLKCWDSNGKELRAYFEKNNELVMSNGKLQIDENQKSKITNLQSFSIVVNDEDAVYPVTIDPLSFNANWTTESNQANANLGNNVATAGDVNGDGYSDVIIPACYYDNGQTDEGKVFVYYGSAAGLSASANWAAEGNQTSAAYGFSISTAGDVNGDGYSDIIIGVPYYDSLVSDAGRAYVYHGSASGLSTVPNRTYQIFQTGAQFGISVSTAGDVNSDGYSDVIVGAFLYDNGQTDEGQAYVYYGSSSGLAFSANWINEVNQAGANYGYSVSTAGDVNGDGYSDVIIGAQAYDNGQTDEGRTYLYYGSAAGLNTSAAWTAESDQANAHFGYNVSTAGDVNGDGYSDVIVGAWAYDNGQTDEGRAFVYHGSSLGLSASANWMVEGNQNNAQCGAKVSTAGDVNGDGYSDVVVAIPRYSNGQANEGIVNLYNGSAGGLSINPSWAAEGDQISAGFGFGLSTAGDVNGDGYSDVLVGAPNYDNGQTNEGKAYVYHGSASGLSASANWSLQGAFGFGTTISTAGDVNGDGYNDMIVGELHVQTPPPLGIYTPSAHVYFGSASGISLSSNWNVQGDARTGAGRSLVSTAGDVNGDGYCDVIWVDAYDTAHVFYGSASGLSATANWRYYDRGYVIYSCSTAGDVNGDGYSDIILGENGGRVAVFYGSGIGLPPSRSKTLGFGTSYGTEASTAGDVNGDGFSDVIIRGNNSKAYVFLGSIYGLSSTAHWTSVNNSVRSVSTAGDVNADGYSDIVLDDNNGNVYVYHGGFNGPNSSANWTGRGYSGSAVGIYVSNAGDVNGDGYSDIIVGSDSNLVKISVYQGAINGLSLFPNWVYLSTEYINGLSAAGDVNGDGYSDVIWSDRGFVNNVGFGRTFSFYGNSGTGLKSTVRQYKYGTSSIAYSQGFTGTFVGNNGNVRLNIFGKSPFGRAGGKIVYEHIYNGFPFSGNIITNSVFSSGSGTNTDLGINGIQLNKDISGLLSNREYKWRARIQYNMVNNPYQKFGPWKYYGNYVPIPSGDFRPRGPSWVSQIAVYNQGSYKSDSNYMIQDTGIMILRNSISPYNKVDSGSAYLSSSGVTLFNFANVLNGVPYYIQYKHRNSIETWSSTPQSFTNYSLFYDFTTAASKAYGSNMIQVDTLPVGFAVYSGDVNQNGSVDSEDLSLADNDVLNFASGYINTDVTGDNQVDAADLTVIDNNVFNYVSMVRP